MSMYKWRKGYTPKVAADVAGEEFDEILETTGTIDLDVVVERAKPRNGRLHSGFEWNDKAAAHQHRLDVAGMLRRHLIHYTETEGSNEPVESRAYDYVEREGERVWASTTQILTTDDGRAQLLTRALNEAKQYQSRYSHLKELAEVMEAISALKA